MIAEREILGAMLLSEEVCQQVCSELKADDFSVSSHQLMFSAASELLSESKPINHISIRDSLGEQKFKAMGGFEWLTDLRAESIARKDVQYLVDAIRKQSQRRRLMAICQKTLVQLEDSGTETSDALGQLDEALMWLAGGSEKHKAISLRDCIPDAVSELVQQSKSSGLVGMSTGVQGIDWATTGIRDGELWIIGALPGRGKTSLGSQILLANGENGIPCGVFSLEMTRTELTKRLFAAKCLTARKLRNPTSMREEDWGELRHAADVLNSYPIWIDDSAGLTLQELLNRARLYARKYSIRLLVVDYLRLIRSSGRDLRQQVGNIADGLREFAKQEQVAVVLLSQLRRPDGGINSKPTMLDLKESGDIEAHAHVVLLLYMPTNEETHELTGEDELIIGKQRNGPVGSFPVYYNPRTLQFCERENREAEIAEKTYRDPSEGAA